MARSRESKYEMAAMLKDHFQEAPAALVTKYSGISSEDIRALRRSLKKIGGEFCVIKNRVAAKALSSQGGGGDESLVEHLKGPVGIAYLYGDVASGAKELVEFAKQQQQFKVTAGLVEGRVVGYNEIKAIAELPSRDVLLAQLLGVLVEPHRRLLGVLNGVSTQVVRVLGAARDKKTQQS